MLANKRTAKAIKVIKYDINSIGTKRGNNPKGAPGGKNIAKNFKPCSRKQMYVRPRKTISDNANVTIK